MRNDYAIPARWEWLIPSAKAFAARGRRVAPLLEIVGDWRDLLSLPSEEEANVMRRHERTGRPLGGDAFVESMEQAMGRFLRAQKPGPKKRESGR